MSYHNLNIITEKGETPPKINGPQSQPSKATGISIQQKRNCDNPVKIVVQLNKDEPRTEVPKAVPDDSTQTVIVDTSLHHLASYKNGSLCGSSSQFYGITTAAIVSRHDSTSSTHSTSKQAWIETESGHRARNNLSKEEIERQNIIHELLTGEKDSLQDLKGVIKHYKEPLEKLLLLSPGDSFNIFYTIEKIIPVYEVLVNLLEEEKNDSGVIICAGIVLLKWVIIRCVSRQCYFLF